MADVETLLKLLFRKTPPRQTPRHSSWSEVKRINSYAVLMGYLSMAVKGMGFLVLTWTTVVLLGGFVSVLEKKDFWCLTAITFMQAAGVFDASRNERLSNIAVSFQGILFSVTPVIETVNACNLALFGAALVAVLIQVLMFAVVLLPIFALYISGPYVPVWLAVWRLRHRDYCNGNRDASSANLQVGLDVLYILVVVQGVLVYYMTFYAFAGKAQVEKVVKHYKFGKRACTSVWDYMDDTRKGCAKDPSFTDGRNLITYAVELIKSESADRNLSGTRILDTVIGKLQILRWEINSLLKWRDLVLGRHMLLKQLIIGSASSDGIIQKLLQMLDSRCPYDKEMRKRAARIVAHFAGYIHLKQFPLGIQWVASLLDTFEEYSAIEPYQRDWLLHTFDQDWCQQAPLAEEEDDDKTAPIDGYKDLILQALCIIWRLAANEDNCVIIRNTVGLLSKIIAPVTNNLVHSRGHDEWSSRVVEESLRVICQLLTAPRGTGKKLCRDISKNKKAIATMESILQCKDCSDRLKGEAIQTLTELYMVTSSSMGTGNREKFMKTLLHIFLEAAKCPVDLERVWKELQNKDMWIRSFLVLDKRGKKYIREIFKTETEKLDIRETAAQALMRLHIVDENCNFANDLTRLLLSAEEETYRRVVAAVVLERLCIYYTDLNNLNKANMKESLFLQYLKESLSNNMSKVLQEILHYKPSEEIPTGTETNHVVSLVPMGDVENQCDESEDNSSRNKRSYTSWCEKTKRDFLLARKRQDAENFRRHFIPASLSLFMTVCETCISTNRDSARLFCAISTSAGAASSVPTLLKEMVERNSESTVHCLRTVKLITKIAISMMKHKGSYNKEDLDSLIVSLSVACSNMSVLDASMVFAGREDGAWRVRDSKLNRGAEQPIRSLLSLVKEAQKTQALAE